MDFILAEMKSQHEIKNRGRFGNGPTDVHAIEVLVRTVRLWEADARHVNMIMEHFCLIEVYKSLTKNGYKEEVFTERGSLKWRNRA